MKYYRVKKECDNYCVSSEHTRAKNFLVQNELYTPREVARYRIPLDCLIEVEVKKNTTYWIFGARFCEAQGHANK